ncbi:hypothetical protein HMPREF7215_1264 [Pyramidobacter piscolens W5455]|uniref:Uncharacterized protein n=1 Tax=Pyramidobacter piscolens W5455 TaxID=352165 RepID=A0ABM9ZW33_9BACT|nr:hypothetical protein HMPREF7215_1264 [Pyramidobacter piscolens W5455]
MMISSILGYCHVRTPRKAPFCQRGAFRFFVEIRRTVSPTSQQNPIFPEGEAF